MRMRTPFLIALSVLALGVGPTSESRAALDRSRDEVRSPDLVTGWVIGVDETGTAVILHTVNGGQEWVVQGDSTLWTGFVGNDISAVDEMTAWAAVGSADDGKILHTSDGGATWAPQVIPEGVGPVKQVKGLSRQLAWAASLDGTILRTTDGGAVWSVVPHPGVPIHQVNRMDAIGLVDTDVRIVDEQGGKLGMIHTRNGGVTWRNEFVDYAADGGSPGLHMVATFSRKEAWCAAWNLGILYRTKDGGKSWQAAGMMSGANDIDDLCAPTADTAWAVQNLGGFSGGRVFHVSLANFQLTVEEFNPAPGYLYEGLTCSDDLHAVVVGSKGLGPDPSAPLGAILSTEDGGATWSSQPVPVNDVAFWKVSFVGARR